MKGQHGGWWLVLLRWWYFMIWSGNGNNRFRLLLCFCLLCAASLLAARVSFIMGWRHHSKSPESRERFTVLINTWRRHSLLKKSVAHYSSCRLVDAIRIVWSEAEPPSQDLLFSLRRSVKRASLDLRFDVQHEDNLNNRFKPLEGLRTEAVFSVDDDVVVPCHTLSFAFSAWASASDSMVGFVPRMNWVDDDDVDLNEERGPNQPHYTYGGWWSVWWTGTYSMVLTKAAFFHRKYLDLYTYHMPSEFRDYVARGRNCEDLAMSFLIANASKAPPIWVKGKIYEIGSTGISSLKGHNKHRTACLNNFASMYGNMPLIPTRVKAMDALGQWFWS